MHSQVSFTIEDRRQKKSNVVLPALLSDKNKNKKCLMKRDLSDLIGIHLNQDGSFASYHNYVVKALYGIVNCDSVRHGVSVNPRHMEAVKFVHFRARTQRLHCSAIHTFPRLWEEFPLDLRAEVAVDPLTSWLGKLRHHLHLMT